MDNDATTDGAETIEIIPSTQPKSGRWSPVVGDETLALLRQLPHESRDVVRDEALAVLSHAVPTDVAMGNVTGLVVGYVQSGKTMSFTTVSALASDNSYQIVIIITGISKPLFNQSTERLRDDLRLQTPGRKWKEFANPKATSRRSLIAAMARWVDPNIPDTDKQTILITVMKNRTHLNNTIRLVKSFDLTGVPALIIDDEADQASLNNLVSRGEESATYRRILDLRQCLPHHTFLQYTATPQAPLLINLIDVLSPEFAEVLTPGPTYTGGIEFFEKNLNLVIQIPFSDVPTNNNILNEPPNSLLEAMRLFFLGVAAGLILGRPPNNRSMMVHPSKSTTQHADYHRWVLSTMRHWQRTLALSEDHSDRIDLLQEFRDDYASLRTTLGAPPSFDDLIRRLPQAIRETVPTEVNTRQGATPSIDWRDYSHILIGGQALDRGYTVEGLTVTYMPRGQGVGNADTIQQRARWFGYKADYLGYCRVYLSGDTLRAYRSYVAHEENVRTQLREHEAMGKSLREWRRAFLLDYNRPTRNSVLGVDYITGNFASKWFEPKVPYNSDVAVTHNREIVEGIRSTVTFSPDAGDSRRTDGQRHLSTGDVSLKNAYEQYLTQLQFAHPFDSSRWVGLLLQIRHYLELHQDAPCTIYLMRPNSPPPRYRRVDINGQIDNIFQGAQPATNQNGVRQGAIYPGDRKVVAPHEVTIQIHQLDEVRDYEHPDGSSRDYSVLATNIPVVAVWLPQDMGAGWVVQDQGGSQ